MSEKNYCVVRITVDLDEYTENGDLVREHNASAEVGGFTDPWDIEQARFGGLLRVLLANASMQARMSERKQDD